MAVRRDRPADTLPKGGSGREDNRFAVVAIGASAGGLDALQSFFDATPADSGLAYVVVQHLDPTHKSMMVELLAGHTTMPVQHAVDGMPIERDNVYVIPPGYFLSVRGGALHLSRRAESHGVRLPFDFLLRSMAVDLGDRAICVILSGTGSDGSIGLKAVKEAAGLVVAQDANEAAFDGMPRNATKTGLVDLVLPVAAIPDAIVTYARRMAITAGATQPPPVADEGLSEIIELLHSRGAHDFKSYKRGTLERRIERRRAMAPGGPDDIGKYVEFLRNDPLELGRLVKDLLINVTSFFRDPEVFDELSRKIIPALLHDREQNDPVRIWSAGCSTGEEAYSLAMLFAEAIADPDRKIPVQIFGTDADDDAIAHAREGVYPETIEAEVSPERLARFFSKDDHYYRVVPELRDLVIFTHHDMLSDPPFSRLDMVSCRNVLIYLEREAQSHVLSLFHFALRSGGLLLLGSSEMVGTDDKRFTVVSKPARLYRHVGRARPGDLAKALNEHGGARLPVRPDRAKSEQRKSDYADLCRLIIMDAYAPAAVLIDSNLEYLYSVGPIDRYLQIPAGRSTQNVVAMLRQTGLRTRLRSAVMQVGKTKGPMVISGGRTDNSAAARRFSIAVHPVSQGSEELALICFIDEPEPAQRRERSGGPQDEERVADLERELEATRAELQTAIHNLETSIEEQNAVNEEALSVNEEFQSANEELLTSKEELQSLNEELVALNGQLQETLDTQRTTANDLQNVLYSTDVATIFLDLDLKIRFFTPAAKNIFNFISSDIGRPLSDLQSLTDENATLAAARAVLQSLSPIEEQVQLKSGEWFDRRIMPYRTRDNSIEGVVITFSNITARKHAEQVLADAQKRAEDANIAKSRFLAAASHDLRQPLQTIALIQGVLSKIVEGEKAKKLIGQLDHTLAAMSGMLNALLDINQIDTGAVQAEPTSFTIGAMFDRLRDEFVYLAQAQGLDLRVVSCSLTVHSDPRLLEQMLRNLISNALKYTKRGKVLIGCRRRRDSVSIEIWDTGQGIPEAELNAIFNEYHQLDNPARERSRGLGLGLAIVQRLGALLGHRISVRSQPGKGSAFAVEVSLPADGAVSPQVKDRRGAGDGHLARRRDGGMILVVEDDPDVRALLEILLTHEGNRVAVARDGGEAFALLAHEAILPDLILADFNLPGGMNGLQVAAKIRGDLRRAVPFVILTGDISAATQRTIAQHDCIQINKPLKAEELIRVVEEQLATARAGADAQLGPSAEPAGGRLAPPDRAGRPVIYIVDDDKDVRNALRIALDDAGYAVEEFSTAEAFLEAPHENGESCLLLDATLPGMSGLELLGNLRDTASSLPSIMITAFGDVAMAVEAMKLGALDFIEKPFGRDDLIGCVERALDLSRNTARNAAWRDDAAIRISHLTKRQREIMELVLAGHPNKNIAADLGISQRTVETHRAAIMKKTGVASLPELARLAVAAESI